MIDQIYIEKLKSNFSEAVRVILANKIRTLLNFFRNYFWCCSSNYNACNW